MCVRSLQNELSNDLFVATYMVTVMKYCDRERIIYCWILPLDERPNKDASNDFMNLSLTYMCTTLMYAHVGALKRHLFYRIALPDSGVRFIENLFYLLVTFNVKRY